MEMESDGYFLFNFWRSTILLGEPSFFGVTVIHVHQAVKVPAGTGSIIPSATSWSRSCWDRNAFNR